MNGRALPNPEDLEAEIFHVLVSRRRRNNRPWYKSSLLDVVGAKYWPGYASGWSITAQHMVQTAFEKLVVEGKLIWTPRMPVVIPYPLMQELSKQELSKIMEKLLEKNLHQS